MRVPRRITVAIFALALAASGCGSDPIPTPDSPKETTLVATLGDSITAGFPGPDMPTGPEDLGTDRSDQFQYWAKQFDPSLRFRNCGFGGQRTDQIASRLEECARSAEAIVIQGGANDIIQALESGPPTTSVAVTDAAENLRQMVEEAKQLGLDVYLADVMPIGAEPRQGEQTDEPVARLNELIERIGEEEGVPVLPFHEVVESPSDPAVYRRSLTADGIHPSVDGYRRLGRLVAEEVGEDGA